MNVPRYAQLAGRVLARHENGQAPPSPQARANAIDVVAEAIRTRARRRTLPVALGAALGVAAAVALALGVSVYVSGRAHPAAVVSAERGPLRIVARSVSADATLASPEPSTADGWTLGPGSRAFAPLDGRLALSLSTGTTALLHEGGDLTVVGTSATQVFRVDAGSVEFHVAKLFPGERFLVDTPDAEVEVRGTQFSVTVAPEPCDNGALTRIAVTEGVVVVRHGGSEVRVRAGGQWPAECERTGPAIAVSALPVASSAPSQRVSALGEQNTLFAAAVAAKQRGDGTGALVALDRLLAKYPATPLGESARAERLRMLHATGSSRASAAAKDYLAKYPAGFARAEAEAVLAGDR